MMRTDVWGLLPGIQAAQETYESAFRWGPAGLGLITGGVISASAVDTGNTPTWELRPGLILGQKTVDATWSNYSAANSDGSEVAAGVLITAIRVQDLLGNNQPHFYGILVAGPVKSSKLLGLDNMARAQMADHFMFDDPLMFSGFQWFPWKRFQTKTANYTATSTDNFTEFDNTGAGAPVTITLPAIANGYLFGIRVIANQNMGIASAEGTNIVAFNNASASSLTFSTGGQLIGGGVTVFSNPGATKWIAMNVSAGTNTITVA